MEVFKDILGYERLYRVSDLGTVKSLSRNIWNGKVLFKSKEKILRQNLTKDGYYKVSLQKNNKAKTFKIHQLIAITFLNYTLKGFEYVCDHINNIPTDNRLENLQVITHRENLSKDKNGTSKFTGVSWCKQTKKWRSSIRINGKSKSIGRFNCELKAAYTYQNELNKLNYAKI